MAMVRSNLLRPTTRFAIFVADLDGDGKPDLILGNATDRNQVGDGIVGVLLRNEDGTFQPVVVANCRGPVPCRIGNSRTIT